MSGGCRDDCLGISTFFIAAPVLAILITIPFIVHNAGAGHRIDVLISIVVILFVVACVSAWCLYAQLNFLVYEEKRKHNGKRVGVEKTPEGQRPAQREAVPREAVV